MCQHHWIALLIVALAPAIAAGGQGKAKGHAKTKHAVHGTSHTDVHVSVFVGDDRRIVREYLTVYPVGGLPPGLAKRGGALPPGLEKQLRRNGRLPPGLEKKLYPFPPALEARLAPLAPDLRRGFIEGHAVIYNPKTSVILDVFIPL